LSIDDDPADEPAEDEDDGADGADDADDRPGALLPDSTGT
jgi:hypothetical protein